MTTKLPKWAEQSKAEWADFQGRHGLTPDGLPGLATLAEVKRLELAQFGHIEYEEFSYGGGEIRNGISRDPKMLIPAFAKKIEKLFQKLIAQGHEPMLWEGFRTLKRAEKLSKRGTGIKKSMHCYGAAVDIIDEADMWNATSRFWNILGTEAEALGLVVLYRDGRRIDRPHIQAIDVEDQPEFRKMTVTQQREFVERRLQNV